MRQKRHTRILAVFKEVSAAEGLREVITSQLDHFIAAEANIPPITPIVLPYKGLVDNVDRSGVLQEYVKHVALDECGPWSLGVLAADVDELDAQRLFFLDYISSQADRHWENILLSSTG